MPLMVFGVGTLPTATPPTVPTRVPPLKYPARAANPPAEGKTETAAHH